MSKKILVTGGAGFLGSALVRRLVREGRDVRVMDNLSRGNARRLSDIAGEFEFIRGDIRNPAFVMKAMKGVECVWHLAFVNGTEFFYQKPEFVLDVGVKGMVNVIDACLKNRVPELILASSSEVYQTPPVIPTDETAPLLIPDPWNPRYSYAAGKIISEIMALNFGRKHFKRVLIFRPHNVYGPDMGREHVVPQFAARLKKLSTKFKGVIRFPIQGSGKETRSFIFIDDFTDALLLLMKKGEHLGIYHIGTTEEVAIAELARLVAKYFGRQIRLAPGQSAAGGTNRRCPNISKIKRLGFRPQFSLEKGLPIALKWYDEQGD